MDNGKGGDFLQCPLYIRLMCFKPLKKKATTQIKSARKRLLVKLCYKKCVKVEWCLGRRLKRSVSFWIVSLRT